MFSWVIQRRASFVFVVFLLLKHQREIEGKKLSLFEVGITVVISRARDVYTSWKPEADCSVSSSKTCCVGGGKLGFQPHCCPWALNWEWTCLMWALQGGASKGCSGSIYGPARGEGPRGTFCHILLQQWHRPLRPLGTSRLHLMTVSKALVTPARKCWFPPWSWTRTRALIICILREQTFLLVLNV